MAGGEDVTKSNPTQQDSETGKETVDIIEDYEEPVLDGGYGWLVVLGSFIGQVVCGGITRSLSLVYAQLLTRYNASATETSWALALFGTCKMIASPVGSFMANRLTHRVTTITGSVIMAAGFVCSGFMPTMAGIYFTMSLVGGFGLSLAFTSTLTILGLYFDKKKGKANALASLGSDVGAMGLPPLMHYVFTGYGFTALFFLIGSVCLQLCISGSLYWPIRSRKSKFSVLRPLQRRNDAVLTVGSVLSLGSVILYDSRNSLNKRDVKDNYNHNIKLHTPCSRKDVLSDKLKGDHHTCYKNEQDSHDKRNTGSCHVHLLRKWSFVRFIALLTVYFMCMQSTVFLIAGLCIEKSFTLEQVSTILVIAAVVCTPVKIISGIIFDLPIIIKYEEATLGLLGVMAGMAVMILPWITGVVAVTIAYVFASSLLILFYMCHVIVLTSSMGPQLITSAMGLARPFLGVGELAGPLIGGLLRDYTGTYRWSYTMFGSIFMGTSAVYTALALVHRCSRHNVKPTSISKTDY